MVNLEVQVVVLDLAFDVPRALSANYSEFPNSWTLRHLALRKDALDVLADGGDGHPEQFRDERLTQPKRFVGKPALEPRPAVLSLVKNDFADR